MINDRIRSTVYLLDLRTSVPLLAANRSRPAYGTIRRGSSSELCASGARIPSSDATGPLESFLLGVVSRCHAYEWHTSSTNS
jgi:hypothetical protein